MLLVIFRLNLGRYFYILFFGGVQTRQLCSPFETIIVYIYSKELDIGKKNSMWAFSVKKTNKQKEHYSMPNLCSLFL